MDWDLLLVATEKEACVFQLKCGHVQIKLDALQIDCFISSL